MSPTPADYIRAGYVLVPIPYIEGRPVKGPQGPSAVGWNLKENAIYTVEAAERLNGAINVGIAHLWSRTCCVDVDDYLTAVEWLSKRGIHLDGYLAAEGSVQICSGRANRAKLCFKLPDGIAFLPHIPANGRGFELRCASRDGTKTLQDCLPPSIHEDTGLPYTWKGDWSNFPVLPEEVLALWRELADTPAPSPVREDGKVGEGDRNDFLMSLAGFLRRKGVGEAEIRATLLAANEGTCATLLPKAEVVGIAKSAARYPPGEAREAPPVGADPGEGGNGSTPPSTADKGNGAERTIAVLAGKLPQTLDAAESALLARGGVYQRGSLLVRVVTIPETRVTQGVRRHKGAMVILPFDKVYLVESLTSAARWESFNPKTDKFCTINCPKTIAEGLLARVGEWSFPVLTGIAEAPYMIEGNIYATPGYEPTTGVYLNLGHNKFPEIPRNPTKQDAEKALQKLKDVVKDFPFVEEVDRAVWISALLTTFVRLWLRSAPMFGFSATVMGTGKSLLTDQISIIATGRRATVMSPALDRKEEQKRLLSVLIEGDPVLVVDNIGEPWASDSMSAILTAETYKDRLLGVNKSVTVPTTATWIATGNNLSFAGDLSSRVLVARLDPRCERPDERSFDRDLLTWVPEHRSELVTAVLTILAAHVAAGCPTGVLRPFGRFEDWSRLVRAAVVWLGMPDPCRARTHIEESDPVKQSLGSVLAAWWDCFKGTPKTVGQAVSSGSDELRAALLIVSGERGTISVRKAGIWFAKYGGRVVDGLRFERAGLSQRSVLWTAVSVESSESVSFSESCDNRTREGRVQNVSGCEQTHQDSQTHQEAGEVEGGV